MSFSAAETAHGLGTPSGDEAHFFYLLAVHAAMFQVGIMTSQAPQIFVQTMIDIVHQFRFGAQNTLFIDRTAAQLVIVGTRRTNDCQSEDGGQLALVSAERGDSVLRAHPHIELQMCRSYLLRTMMCVMCTRRKARARVFGVGSTANVALSLRTGAHGHFQAVGAGGGAAPSISGKGTPAKMPRSSKAASC